MWCSQRRISTVQNHGSCFSRVVPTSLVAGILVMTLAPSLEAGLIEATEQDSKCKYPNEGCDSNKECCSGKCVKAHTGTNPRCTKLMLHGPCLYDYQCQGDLMCGTNYTCCAKYWDVCRTAADCCNLDHGCFHVEAFYYKRCIYPSNANSSERTTFSYVSMLSILTAVVIFYIMTSIASKIEDCY